MSWAETLGLPANPSAFLYYRLRTVTQIAELHPRLRKKPALMAVFVMWMFLHQIDIAAAVLTILLSVRVMAVAVS